MGRVLDEGGGKRPVALQAPPILPKRSLSATRQAVSLRAFCHKPTAFTVTERYAIRQMSMWLLTPG